MVNINGNNVTIHCVELFTEGFTPFLRWNVASRPCCSESFSFSDGNRELKSLKFSKCTFHAVLHTFRTIGNQLPPSCYISEASCLFPLLVWKCLRQICSLLLFHVIAVANRKYIDGKALGAVVISGEVVIWS